MRTTAPTNDNKFYLQPQGGGYNLCIQGNANNKYNKRPTTYSVLPNCVGYAYGRYLEFWGLTKANLPTCNAKDWYAVAKARGFKCSQTPTVGAVACFSGNTYGHVAFVEEVKPNGDIVVSESNWSYSFFALKTVTKASGYAYLPNYPLVGFIANPNATDKPKEEHKEEVVNGFVFPSRGYYCKYDISEEVGKVAEFMFKVFPAYTKKEALGNLYGENIMSSIKTFQKNTGLEADGLLGRKTLAKLIEYGFKVD